jgi:predicted nucleic acid-binding protein
LGIGEVQRFLRRNPRVALDTNIFVYQLESHPRYKPLTKVVFDELDDGGISAVASTITMTELLVPAYRQQDDQRVDQFYGWLSTYPNLEWLAPDLEIADLAAELRASHNLKTPDALHAATAIQGKASGFVTNDPVFGRVKQFESLVLDRIV